MTIPTPRPTDVSSAAGISMSYASMILKGKRNPPLSMALKIHQTTGWKVSRLEGLSDEQIELLAQAQDQAA